MYQPSCGHDRVASLMWLCGMSAKARDRPVEFIGGGHHGACHKAELTDGCIGVDVLTKDHRRNGVLECTIGDHHTCAAGREFFTRLEQQFHGAAQRGLVFFEDLRRRQQHRRMHVVSAGMHHTRMFRGIG